MRRALLRDRLPATRAPDCVLRIDLHNHTDYSPDGVLSPLRLLLLARARGLDCIAVTDHNRLEGALRCLELAEGDSSLPRVIPGVEVRSRHGEIVGLFLERDIPAGRSALHTIDLIRAQGGIVYLPHPYDVFRRATLTPDRVEEVARHVDVIEVANGGPCGLEPTARHWPWRRGPVRGWERAAMHISPVRWADAIWKCRTALLGPVPPTRVPRTISCVCFPGRAPTRHIRRGPL